MNINNFIIDHVLRGIMTNSAGEYQWSINQVTEPSLSVTLNDAATATDALGGTIAQFDRGRNASFSAQNSLFDLGLYAAQLGQAKKVASVSEKIVAPMFEEFVVAGTVDETHVLKEVPTVDPTAIYLQNGDGTLSTKYVAGTTASATEFAYDSSTHTISLPTGLTAGSKLFVLYEYESDEAVSVTADAVHFPKTGVFYLEVLGADVCDPETLIHAYLKFPSAKLDGNVDISFTTDGNHPFVINAFQSYCDNEKKLFSIIIPAED